MASADPAGLLYGAIVAAATLAAVSLHEDDPNRVWGATGVVLVIYWMADLYVHALTTRFDGNTRSLLHRLAVSAAHKSSVLKGGLPAIVVSNIGRCVVLRGREHSRCRRRALSSAGGRRSSRRDGDVPAAATLRPR